MLDNTVTVLGLFDASAIGGMAMLAVGVAMFCTGIWDTASPEVGNILLLFSRHTAARWTEL